MYDIPKLMLSLDEKLSGISVSGESVMLMAQARMMTKNIYEAAQSEEEAAKLNLDKIKNLEEIVKQQEDELNGQ